MKPIGIFINKASSTSDILHSITKSNHTFNIFPSQTYIVWNNGISDGYLFQGEGDIYV